jgi:hypothetical protein
VIGRPKALLQKASPWYRFLAGSFSPIADNDDSVQLIGTFAARLLWLPSWLLRIDAAR